MSESLFVGEKEYLPSTSAAKLFGYTSDYVSHLAREKKIIAASINRRWYIQKDSLADFVAQSQRQKKERRKEIKKQREVERIHFQQKQKKEKIQQRMPVYTALGQSFAVLLCGICVGLLGNAFFEHEVTIPALLEGTTQLGNDVVAMVFAGVPALTTSAPPFMLSTISPKRAIKPKLYDGKNDVYEVPITKENSMQFSDEVYIEHLPDGRIQVYPIFDGIRQEKPYVITP